MEENVYELTNEEQQLVNKLYELKQNGTYMDSSAWGLGGYDGVESPLKDEFQNVNIIASVAWNDADELYKMDIVESEIVITDDFRIGYTCCDNTGYTCQFDYKILGPYVNYEEVVLMGLTNNDRNDFIKSYVKHT